MKRFKMILKHTVCVWQAVCKVDCVILLLEIICKLHFVKLLATLATIFCFVKLRMFVTDTNSRLAPFAVFD